MTETVSKQAARTIWLRRLLRSRPVIAGLVLLLIYAASGFFLAPWLVRQQLPTLIEKHLGAQGSVANVRINPFLLTVETTDLAITEKNGTPAIQIGRLFLDFETSSLLRMAWTFREIRIERPVINAELDEKESLNLARLLAHAKPPANDPPAAGASTPPRLLLQHFAVTGGSFRFTDHTLQPVARAQFDPVNFEMHDVSTLPDHRGEHALTARLPGGGAFQWRGKFTLSPVDFSGSMQLKDGKLTTLWRFVQDHLTIAEPTGNFEIGFDYRMHYRQGALDLGADKIAFRVNNLALMQQKGGAVLGKIGSIAFEDGQFNLGKRSLGFGSARIADGTVNIIIDRNGTPDWSMLVRNPPAAKTASAAPAPENTAPKTPWQINLPKASIGPLAIAITDQSRVRPLAISVARAEAGASVTATIGNQTQVVIDGGSVKLGDLRLRSGDDKDALTALAGAEISTVSFDLEKKSVRVGLLRMVDGKTRVARAANGDLNLATAFAAAIPKPDKPSTFSVALDRAEISNHALSFIDQSTQPALSWDLDRVRVRMSEIAMPARRASPIELSLGIKQGGSLKASGRIDLPKQSADIRFEAADIALAPLNPLLSRDTRLTLASGKAGAAGRLVWNGKNTALRYTGSASVTDLGLNIEGSGERLLGWQQLAASGIDLDTGENRVGITRVSLVRPYSKLIVNKDRTTNLGGIMRPREAVSEPASQGKSPSMNYNIDRISVEHGELDFSDLSLVLPFSTNIKALGGSANGLSSVPESRASLKFEGRIEDSGLARAEGTIQPFAPKRFTDITVNFRNVALTPLSPYTATFAGRKISSGKLSLDLQYKLENSQLAGDNKVLLEQFTLGERVESPNAANLPLDLAIALLTDSEGKIDLAVPVSGNVDQPEFSYGHLVWQAIRTVITRIVTAPFRALGALFGGGNQSVSEVAFDPGSDRILPPEYEKLRHIAEGLQKRPQLKLVVRGTFNKEGDGLALRTQAVRNDLALREGLKLTPGEDPGPVAFDSAKTQRALENMLNERAGSDAAARFAETLAKTSGREISRVNPVLAMMGRGPGTRELYEAMYRRLIELQPLADSALTELANRRGQALIGAFTQRLKFNPDRVGSKPAEASDETVKNGIPIKLSFEPLKP